METRHAIEIYFGREFSAICSLRSSGGLKSPEFENFQEIFATPYDKIFKILFGKFSLLHRSTLLCAKFVKIVWREIGEIVRCLPDKKKQNFGSLSNCCYCADRAQSLPWPAPKIWLTTFNISSNSVHFRWSYSRPRDSRSWGPLGKSNTRPKRYIALGE